MVERLVPMGSWRGADESLTLLIDSGTYPGGGNPTGSNWDSHWARQALTLPAPEPAYFFVTGMIRQAYGRIRGVRVIELGSGRGDMSFLLAKAGAQVTLVDSSPFALRQARARFAECGLEAEYVEADLLGTQIQGDWDVSMSFGLAEHFTGEELQVILDAHTIGKLAFVSVPNALCIPYRIWKSALELTGRWPYGREKPLTKAGLREKMCEIFDDVSVFTTPLSYNLNRRIGLPVRVRWPIDTALGYQLVACGAKRVTEL